MYTLSKVLAVIWPPVIGGLLWRAGGYPLWVGLAVGGAGMLAAIAASPFALLAAATEDDDHVGIRQAARNLDSSLPGAGLALVSVWIIDLFRSTR